MSVEELVEVALRNREELKSQIVSLIRERCDVGHGRVQRGALHLYLYRKLGFYGHPGNDFARYITKILTDAGFRDSYLRGARCYYGLSFKGEKKEVWRKPQASDIPRWIGNHQKFCFLDEV